MVTEPKTVLMIGPAAEHEALGERLVELGIYSDGWVVRVLAEGLVKCEDIDEWVGLERPVNRDWLSLNSSSPNPGDLPGTWIYTNEDTTWGYDGTVPGPSASFTSNLMLVKCSFAPVP